MPKTNQAEQTKLLNEIPISEVAHQLGIETKNKNISCFTGHDQNTKSLRFYLNTNRFKCFGSCNQSGGPINLVMAAKNLDFKQAKSFLLENFPKYSNAQLNKVYFSEKQKATIHPLKIQTEKYRPDHEIYSWLIEKGTIGNKLLDIFSKKRNYDLKTLEHFKIRQIGDAKKILSQALSIWGYDRLHNCGLIKTENKIIKFPFYGTIALFPFFNSEGNIINFQAKPLGKSEVKYINLFGIGHSVFNLQALNTITSTKKIFICEGLTDVLSLYQAEEENAIGIPGAHTFKPEWVDLFINCDITILPDNDIAGESFAKTIQDYFEKRGLSVSILKLKNHKDISEMTGNG